MAMTSPRFSQEARLQAAARNSPPMRRGEQGRAVRIVQRAYVDLGFAMPVSTGSSGHLDGLFGNETVRVTRDFQRQHHLTVDGVVGRQTLGKLDTLLPGPAPVPPTPPAPLPYDVPGTKTVLAQPSPMSCWATVYTMMRSWRDQVSYPIADAVSQVGQKWLDYYNASYPPTQQGLPSHEFGAFLRAASMHHQPMMNHTIEGWAYLLRDYGLLWIGASVTVNPNTGLHSRIVTGIYGNGEADGTWMKIIDPAGGRRYNELFAVFLAKYESGILSVSSEYFQVRHF